MSEHKQEEWINIEAVLLINTRNLKVEKDFILSIIRPFAEKHKSLIDLFHFTRIYNGKENFIRWRIKPKLENFSQLKTLLIEKLNDCKAKNVIIDYRKESFDKDSTHDKVGCNPRAYDIFMKYLDSISRITIELLERQPEDYHVQGFITPDYYAHFLFNQFGSNSLYNACQCHVGSWTIHPCFFCKRIPIPRNMIAQN